MRVLNICFLLLICAPAYSCVCTDYFDIQQGASHDTLDFKKDGYYHSAGSTTCTSVKETDQKIADSNARFNLSRFVSSKIQVNETVSSYRSGLGGASLSFKSQAALDSSTVLNNSMIYARWIDVNNCQVVSAVKVSQKDIDAFLETLSRTKTNSELTYYLQPSGRSRTDNIVRSFLVNKKIKLVDTNSDYVIDVKVGNTTPSEHGVEVLLFLSFKNNIGEELLFDISKPGKSVDFHNQPYERLLDKAIDDALERSSEELEIFLSQEVVL